MGGFFPFFCFLSVLFGTGWGIVQGNLFLAVSGSVSMFLGSFWAYRKQHWRLFEVSILIFFAFIAQVWVMPSVSFPPDEHLAKRNTCTFGVKTIVRTRNRVQSFRANIYEINGNPVRIRARVRDFSSLPKQYPYRYRAEGTLSLRRYRDYEYYQLWIPKDSSQRTLPDSFVRDIVSEVTRSVIGVYRKYLPEAAGSFLSAVFLGRREFLNRGLRDSFSSAGIVHLLAISGLHMGLVMWILMYLLKILGISFRRRIILSLGALAFYVVLVGGAVASIRAAIMCGIFGLSFLLSRRTHPLNNLGIAGMIIIFLDPLVVSEVGFQLSFLSVGGIILAYTLLNIQVQSGNILLTYGKNILYSSFWVNIFIWPLLAWYFHRIYVLALSINIVMIPLFALIMFTNCIFLLFSFLPGVNILLAEILSFLVFLFVQMTKFFAGVPFMYLTVRLPFPALCIYYGLLAILVSFLFKRKYFNMVSPGGKMLFANRRFSV